MNSGNPQLANRTGRAFFALWPDQLAARQLHELAVGLTEKTGGRAMREENLHLTLAFLGELPADRLAAACVAAEQVRAPAFRLKLDMLGYWAHNRLLWSGCTNAGEALTQLSATLSAQLRTAGFVLEKRPFSPHVSLVRNVKLRDDPPRSLPAVTWQCDRFVLAHSDAVSPGAAYRFLAT